MMNCYRLAGMGLVLMMASVATAADTVESVQKRIVEQWEKLSSMSAKLVMTSSTTNASMTMTTMAEGTFEYMKKGDQKSYRTDMKITMLHETGGKQQKNESTTCMIDDGTSLYSLSTVPNLPQPSATKTKSRPGGLGGSSQAMFDRLHEKNTLKLLPEASVDGQVCYVIEATAKKESSPQLAKALNYFRKNDGVVAKSVGFDGTGKQILMMTYSDIQINSTIDPQRFVFEAPQGVQVMDMTKMDMTKMGTAP
ncbi:MAG: hypothetical protein IID43_02655 [Planctomycetes bacterium]|nr:hypothetical protein [Planctomycetota bacterium]